MSFFKVKVDDKVYSLERLTLGDARLLKERFGLADLEEFNPSDPDQLVGLLFLALRKERPTEPEANLLAEIEDLDIDAFSQVVEESGADAGPPVVEDGEPEAASV